MHSILQLDQPEDFIIATGVSITLEKFIIACFEYFGLNYKNHLIINKELYRPTDILISRANPSKANEKLKWKAKTDVYGVINYMINYYLENTHY